ncbi:MAG TPA: hypothetical protein VGU46_10225 [Acidobacteriaceae bacterium]|nr:hypothetical protein [Acidobacteriaceae bacterium]
MIHYVVFLMAHGFAPYRDIVEMNMPGTYLLEFAGIHLFGPGALGWWLWDVSSGLAAIAASAWIAGKNRRAAGIAGGSLAYLFHLQDGPMNLGQRDWIVAVFLLVAFGFLFTAIRRTQPIWMAGSMAAFTCAASIKPPALAIGICFFLAACWVIRRNEQASRLKISRFFLWGFLGGLVPSLICLGFLLSWGVARDFLHTLSGLVPYYAGLQRVPYARLVLRAFIPRLVLPGAFAVFLLARSWRNWEHLFLAAATLAAAMLYVVQGKGWSYHRYPEVAFASLWAMVELGRALHSDRREQIVAAATLVVTLFVSVPQIMNTVKVTTYPDTVLQHLQQDLNRLGGSALSGKVQCLDMTMGSCINVLYRMQLVQSTGFIYDFYLFPEHNTPLTAALQTRFLNQITSNPPQVIVLSSHTWPGDFQGYGHTAYFPALTTLLAQKYRLDTDFHTPWDASFGYRIYALKDPHN